MTEPKILIIDDDSDFRESAKIILQSANFCVMTAVDGAEGLMLAQKQKPDIILLDIMMPGADGYSICRQIKEDPTICNTIVIIVSSISQGAGTDYLKKIARNHRADGYLEKPLAKDILLTTLSDIINKRTKSLRSTKEKKRILIIDDDTDILISLELVLKRNGYEVFIAESSIEGIKLAKAFNPDAIILDVMLPDKDGYTTCYELKKDADTHQIPVLILTALPASIKEPEYAQNIAQDHLADAYATKPITPDELLKKIKDLINDEP